MPCTTVTVKAPQNSGGGGNVGNGGNGGSGGNGSNGGNSGNGSNGGGGGNGGNGGGTPQQPDGITRTQALIGGGAIAAVAFLASRRSGRNQ